MDDKKYPTEWQLGKTRGSIKEEETYYMTRITPPKKKEDRQKFFFDEYETKKAAYDAACAYCVKFSNDNNLTRNKIRYLDKDTIEVQLTKNKTMKTDAKFINEVEKYPINLKSKEVKNGTNYYAMCQNKKKSFLFTNLICDYKIIEYINKDTLDIRSSNIKEFGSVTKTIDADDDEINQQDNYFYMELDKLPRDIWLLGKPAGTNFYRGGQDAKITVRVKDENGKEHEKTFTVSNYKDENEALREASKWQRITSYQLGMTKNLIQIIQTEQTDEKYKKIKIDTDVIEVKLTKNKTMIVDKIFIPVIQKLPLFITTSGSGMNYVGCVVNDVNKLFHTLITGFSMVDHINGNTLDNRLQNLRPVTSSMNNSNRHDFTETTGIKETDTIFGKVIQSSIIIEGRHFSKMFKIIDNNKEDAMKKAVNFRNKVTQTKDFEEYIDKNDDQKVIEILLKKVLDFKRHAMLNFVYNVNEYMKGVKLDTKKELDTTIRLDATVKQKIFNYYFSHQMSYYRSLEKSFDKLFSYLRDKMICKMYR